VKKASFRGGDLPAFLCIGAQKSGTTLLYEILSHHPQIFLPREREHFFDIDETFRQGIDWYRHYFRGSSPDKITGDVIPAYIFFEDVPLRIRDMLGTGLKFIAILRNPVDRAYSHYWMSFRRRYETRSFEDAIVLEHARMRKGYFERNNFSYVSRGFYTEQIARYTALFPAGNLKIVLFEEFTRDPARHAEEILRFLGCSLEGWRCPIRRKVHAGDLDVPQFFHALRTSKQLSLKHNLSALGRLSKGKKASYPPMKKTTRKLLGDLFRDEVAGLAKFLGRDLSAWHLD
jgi:hypothetical protein